MPITLEEITSTIEAGQTFVRAFEALSLTIQQQQIEVAHKNITAEAALTAIAYAAAAYNPPAAAHVILALKAQYYHLNKNRIENNRRRMRRRRGAAAPGNITLEEINVILNRGPAAERGILQPDASLAPDASATLRPGEIHKTTIDKIEVLIEPAEDAARPEDFTKGLF